MEQAEEEHNAEDLWSTCGMFLHSTDLIDIKTKTMPTIQVNAPIVK
jgi:hypothetical protein